MLSTVPSASRELFDCFSGQMFELGPIVILVFTDEEAEMQRKITR